MRYQTWCGKSCGFPAHVDRKTEFCVCVCEGGQMACSNLLQEDYTTPWLSLMFLCQRESRSSSSTGAWAGGHSDREDMCLFYCLTFSHIARRLLVWQVSGQVYHTKPEVLHESRLWFTARLHFSLKPNNTRNLTSPAPVDHCNSSITYTPTTQTLSKYIHTQAKPHTPTHPHKPHTYTLSKCLHANHTPRHTQSVNTFKPTHKHCPYTRILPKTPDLVETLSYRLHTNAHINEDNIYKKYQSLRYLGLWRKAQTPTTADSVRLSLRKTLPEGLTRGFQRHITHACKMYAAHLMYACEIQHSLTLVIECSADGDINLWIHVCRNVNHCKEIIGFVPRCALWPRPFFQYV